LLFSYSHSSDGNKSSGNNTECLLDFAMGVFIPSPAVVVIYNIIFTEWCHSTISLKTICSQVGWDINSIEVVIFLLVKIWQIPIKTDVLKGKVVPFVVIWVVWNFVVVNILSFSKNTLNFDQLSGINLCWSGPLVLQIGRNPSSVDNNGTPVNSYWLIASKELFEACFTTFIAVQWIDDIISWNSTVWVWLWDQNFFGVVQLAK